MDIRSFKSRDACLRAFADFVGVFLSQTLRDSPRASFAVSGGRTPVEAFPLIADTRLDWARVDVTLTDERCVPPDHPDSNEGLARRHLLIAAAGAARMVGLYDGSQSPSLALAAADSRLATLRWPLDLAYLGVGEDGHIASLFPHGGWRDCSTTVRCVAATAPDGRPRLSLSPTAIAATRQLVLLAPGKRGIVERALTPGPVEEWPARLLASHPAAVAFTCD